MRIRSTQPIHTRKAEIISLYQNGHTLASIGRMVGYSDAGILYQLKKWGVLENGRKKRKVVVSPLPLLSNKNACPIYSKSEEEHSRAYFQHESELHNWDYGRTAYECGLIMKKRRELDDKYNAHAKMQWMPYLSEEERTRRLSILDEEINKLEKELSL